MMDPLYPFRWIGTPEVADSSFGFVPIERLFYRNNEISDKKQIAEWAEDHAEDFYFFMTRVRGEFPTASALQFIPTELVEDAMTREIVRQPNDPLILGVDVARFGDDCSVLYASRGLDARSILPMVFRGISTDRLEDKILEFCSQNRVEVIFIDGAGLAAVWLIICATATTFLSKTSNSAAKWTAAIKSNMRRSKRDVGQSTRCSEVLGDPAFNRAARSTVRSRVRF